MEKPHCQHSPFRLVVWYPVRRPWRPCQFLLNGQHRRSFAALYLGSMRSMLRITEICFCYDPGRYRLSSWMDAVVRWISHVGAFVWWQWRTSTSSHHLHLCRPGSWDRKRSFCSTSSLFGVGQSRLRNIALFSLSQRLGIDVCCVHQMNFHESNATVKPCLHSKVNTQKLM